MKLSEVIAEIENGSERTYVAKGFAEFHLYKHHDGLVFEVYRQGKLIDSFRQEGSFSYNCPINSDWKPLVMFVDYKEALKSMTEGKNIFCELSEQVIKSNESGIFLTKNMINKGIWGIEM